MTSWHRYRVALFLVATLAVVVCAQDTEYEQWLKGEEGKLKQFKEERDKEFTKFLKKEWKVVDRTDGEILEEKPLPGPLPVYQGTSTALPPSDIKPVVSIEIPKPPAPLLPKAKPPVPEGATHTVAITYYALALNIDYIDVPAIDVPEPVTKDQISKAWDILSGWNYKIMINQVDQERIRHRLNDWGYVTLMYEIARSLTKDNERETVLLTWFLLTKAGYEVKIAFNEKSLRMLFPSYNKLYGVPYFTMENDELRFYEPPMNHAVMPETRVYTYEGKYPGSDKQLRFSISELPLLTLEKLSRELSFQYNDTTFHLKTDYSKDAVQYFEYYPQTEYEIYFTAPLSREASGSLLPQLADIVKGKTEAEAVNILLRFVQTAFQYKIDAEQFGREKPFFPDEILYYPYSNCKDRAIFFATLIRSILHYEVIGLYYPDHVATAVRFQGELAGDAVQVRGKKFIICDPTYVNANIGMCMPQFKNVIPTVIEIKQ